MTSKKINILPMTREQSLIAAALFVGFFVVWFLWAVLEWPSIACLLKSKDAAAWVQAIGSVVAILVAVFLPIKMKTDDKKEKIEIETKLAVNKFLIMGDDIQSLVKRIKGYSDIIDASGGLGDIPFLWSQRYRRVFEKYKLPNREDFHDLDLIPGDFSSRLLIILLALEGSEDALYFSYELSLETTDFQEKNRLLSGSIELINENIDHYYNEIGKLYLDFKESYSSNFS